MNFLLFIHTQACKEFETRLAEVVKLVESILADYRDKVQDEASVNHLLAILDAFVEAGWPEALNLVWRLDEIYR